MNHTGTGSKRRPALPACPARASTLVLIAMMALGRALPAAESTEAVSAAAMSAAATATDPASPGTVMPDPPYDAPPVAGFPRGERAGDTIGGFLPPSGSGAPRLRLEAGFDLVQVENLYADGSPAYASPGSALWLRKTSAQGRAALRHGSRYLDVIASVSAKTDAKYGGFVADIPGGRSIMYFSLDEGGLGTSAGPLSFRAGRLRHYDVFDSPYSLVVNSRGIAALLANLAYDDGFFFYETRWVELNRSSVQTTPAWPSGFPDRGANFKTYGLRFRPADGGTLRIGYQDIAVYSRRSFDLEYFLNPIPQNLIQYMKGMFGRPWADGHNDNTVLALFADYRKPGSHSFHVQVLADDLGLGFLLPEWSNNPWQVAMTAGGRLETRNGSIGLHAAGSTKYTFAPNMTMPDAPPDPDAYGYTYYPDSRFFDRLDGHPPFYSAISPEDNMIGYKYGENSAAIRADWTGTISGTRVSAGLEFRLAGPNSITNPWHDLRDQVDGTRWFDDPVLEKRFLAELAISRNFGPWKLGLDLDAGVAFDALRLSMPVKPADVSDADWARWSTVDRFSPLYRPTAGQIDPLFRLRIGVSRALDLR